MITIICDEANLPNQWEKGFVLLIRSDYEIIFDVCNVKAIIGPLRCLYWKSTDHIMLLLVIETC